MSLVETLQNQIKDAMRAKQSDRLIVLRSLAAALKQIRIDQGLEIDDAVVIREVTRQIKQRHDASAQYRQAGREELAAKEEAEITVLMPFLPQQLNEEEVRARAVELLAQSALPHNMASMKEFMNLLRGDLQGRADMAAVSKIARDLLQS